MPMKPTDTPRGRRSVCPPPIWNATIAQVAAAHRINAREMLSGVKSDKACAARQELWWRLKNQRGISLAEIGRRMGGFHHTTVMHGVRMWELRVKKGVGA